MRKGYSVEGAPKGVSQETLVRYRKSVPRSMLRITGGEAAARVGYVHKDSIMLETSPTHQASDGVADLTN